MRKLIAILIAVPLFAAGFQLSGIGASGIQQAGANITGISDWTSIYYNPASCMNIKGNMLGVSPNTVVLQGMYVMNTGLIGYDGGYATTDTVVSNVKTFIIPSIGTIRALNDNTNIGFAAFSPFGLGSAWKLYKVPEGYYNTSDSTFVKPEFPEENWKSNLKVFCLYASVSHSFNDKFKVGIAGGPVIGSLDLEKVSLFDLASSDSSALSLPIQIRLAPIDMKLNTNGVSFGVNAGMLYSPVKNLNMGIAFRYYNKIPLDGDVNGDLYLPKNDYIAQQVDSTKKDMFEGGVSQGSGKVSTNFVLPYEGTMGFSYNFSKFTLNVAGTYTKWDKFQDIAATFKDFSIMGQAIPADTIKEEFHATYKISFGGSYRLNNQLTLLSGIYYDKNAAPDSTFNPLIPDVGDKISLNGGVDYKINSSISIGIGGEYLLVKDRDVARADNYSIYSSYMPGHYALDAFSVNSVINVIF